MIDKITVTLTPTTIDFDVKRSGSIQTLSVGSARLRTLTVELEVNGKRFEKTLPVYEDDLTSRFDLYFDLAKNAIKDAIKSENQRKS